MAGTAKFAWTDQDSVAQTFTCQLRVQNRVPGWHQEKDEAWSLDGSVREVITYGDPLHEIACSVRHDTDDDKLAALIRDGLAGINVTYTPDTDVPGTTATVQIVIASEIRVEREGRQNLFAADLLMRRLDGNEIP